MCLIKKYLRGLIFLIAIFLPDGGTGQILPFKTYSVKDGLVSNDIEAIAQDSYGRMWFGTSDGISVFDGKSFTNYTMKDGLPHNFVMQILADRASQGTMWILAGSRMCRFRSGLFKTYELKEGVIASLYQDRQNRIWCATGQGAVIVDGDSMLRFNPPLLREGYKDMVEIGDSVIWFAQDRSLIMYSRKQHTFKTIQISSPASETFHSMRTDSEGDLWVSLGLGGILQIRDTAILDERAGYSDKSRQFFGSNIYDAHGDRIWTYGYNGISSILKSQIATTPLINYGIVNGLPENTIRSAFIDREGNLWLGGRDRGLAKLSSWNVLRFPLGSVWYVHHHQFAATDSQNHIWVIADERLTEFWLDHIGAWHQYAHPIPRADSLILPDVGGLRIFSSLYIDRKGRLWISSLRCPGPIECYDIFPDSSMLGNRPSTMKLVKTIWVGREFSGDWMRILCFLVDRNDDLWVSITGCGIAHYSTQNNESLLRLYREPDLVNYVRSLYEDRNGHIWAGTFNSGLFKLSTDNISAGGVRRYTTAEGLPDNATWDVREDHQGKLFVGTSNGGLVGLARDSTERPSVVSNLPSNMIHSMTEDSLGRLWLATSLGMIYEDHPGSRNFLKTQPFIGSSALCCGTTKTGLIWFVTATDLIVYDYAHDIQDTTSPPITITGLKVNGNSQTIMIEERFSYDQDNCEISFIGISFKDENAIRYKYRLLDEDRDWHDPTYSTSVTYGHLDPGSYRFEVKAINIDGMESAGAATIGITILSPYWDTWWFRLVVATTFLCAGLLIYFTRVSSLKKTQLAQQEFSRQLIDSHEVERKRVAGELHDGVGQYFLVVLSRAKMAMRSSSSSEAATDLKEIVTTAQQGIDDVREVAFGLSPYDLEQFGLESAIETMLKRMTLISKLCYSTELAGLDTMIAAQFRIHVYRIVQECISNIVKHAKASKVVINARRVDGYLHLTVQDDGQGIDQKQLAAGELPRRGFGLAGLKERVNLLNGSLQISSSPDQGTTVAVTIPLRKSDKQHSS